MNANDYDACQPSGSTDEPHTTGVARRSPALALLGLMALGVAGWGLLGGPNLPDAGVTAWSFVVIGLAVGLLLILSGAVSSRRS